ncbi:7003_t:CDS:2 [Dentiscutata erythropus]|uniref:7003_t:CDS:1 n=1 Tax=Dentiscutata erythropus TaxID=1348616 RepID=A0A9N9CUB3_9GLOM|nr:7003_t:CDS:2 [Dentiscutata erythropus]
MLRELCTGRKGKEETKGIETSESAREPEVLKMSDKLKVIRLGVLTANIESSEDSKVPRIVDVDEKVFQFKTRSSEDSDELEIVEVDRGIKPEEALISLEEFISSLVEDLEVSHESEKLPKAGQPGFTGGR